MSLDINKVPIKYIIGSYIDDPLYPSPDDILYIMTKRASDKGKELNPVTFTDNVLLKKLDVKYHDSVKKSIEDLIKSNKIEISRESKSGKSYTILKNPFI